ncbi:ABC transporter substrate-binding protein [Streptosporangium sp. NPDC001681]|uniref:ABC transporter substrate-binding protein n=1 Tax=Streptosporangium sp. NPDC001681 TaxID=3154395 RepID=UPI003317BB95
MRNAGAAALGALSLFAAACGGTADSPSGGPADGGTFSFAIGSDPGVLDPAMGVLSVTNTVLSPACDTLTRVGPDGKVIPGLAEKWDVKPDSVTFTLRKEVTCSDGSKLISADVAANVNHIVDPATKSPMYGVLVPTGMKATADDAAGTVTLSTPKPFSFILQSTSLVFIVCGKGVEDRSVLARGTSGSGPYSSPRRCPGDHYTFQSREEYAWGPDGATTKEPGLPAKVVLKVVPNSRFSPVRNGGKRKAGRGVRHDRLLFPLRRETPARW